MRERAWGPVVKVVCAAVLCAGGAALAVTAFPIVGGATWADAVGPFVVGVALIGMAGVLVGPALGRRLETWREIRKGLRQIETVLRLESALAARRVAVIGRPPGCPRCGAPAGPNGPVCDCPRR